jgi:WD40 repeat protein
MQKSIIGNYVHLFQKQKYFLAIISLLYIIIRETSIKQTPGLAYKYCRTNNRLIISKNVSTFQVQIFNPLSNDVHKSLTKFRETAYGGTFRSDGQLMCVGCDDGKVRLFSVGNKTLLRTFDGHENATHRCDFLSDTKTVASFSDDKTVRIWDMATESEVIKFAEHKVIQKHFIQF